MAPAEYIGRYMPGWFDFAIADELHQLAGDTAQGNALGVLGTRDDDLAASLDDLSGIRMVPSGSMKKDAAWPCTNPAKRQTQALQLSLFGETATFP